jgi:hypothetical protein
VAALEEEPANGQNAAEVVDANDQVVGVVIGSTSSIDALDTSNRVAMLGRAGGRSFTLIAESSHLEGAQVFFESSDCSGQPYQYVSSSLSPVGSFIPPGANVYVPEVNATPQSIEARSARADIFPFFQPCASRSETMDAVPLEFLADLGEVSPPFSIR